MSASYVQIAAGGNFENDKGTSLFAYNQKETRNYKSETFEIPFNSSGVSFGDKVVCNIPAKNDKIKRITAVTTLSPLYTTISSVSYVYPLYSTDVDGSVFTSYSSTQASIVPADTVGYFNTPYINYWATNYTGYLITVEYDAASSKFIFRSSTYAYIYFKNEQSASFWGFDIRSPDLLVSGYSAFKLINGQISGPLSIIQSGWITGISPPPASLKYINNVGSYIIKKASLHIGGQCIDELTGERLFIENDLNVPYENQAALTILEGKNDTSIASEYREYYTKLTFNIKEIDMRLLYRQDLQVKINFGTFSDIVGDADIPTTNGFSDGKSFKNVNIKNILFGQTSYTPRQITSLTYDKYIYMLFLYGGDTYWHVFYDTTKPIENPSSYYKWADVIPAYTNVAPNPYFINEYLYVSNFRYVWRMKINDIIENQKRTLYTTASYDVTVGNSITISNVDTSYTYVGQTYYLVDTNTNWASGYVTGFTSSTITMTIRQSQQIYNASVITWTISPTFTRSTYAILSDKLGNDAAIYARQSGQINKTFADARYLYMYCYLNYNASIPGMGTYGSWYSSSPPGGIVSTFTLTLKYFNKTTPTTGTQRTNIATYVRTNMYPQPTTVTWASEVVSFSNILVTFTATYPQPADTGHDFGSFLFETAAWIRYDTTKDINSIASYEYAIDNSQGFTAIKTLNSILSVPTLEFKPYSIGVAFDGRYLYTAFQSVSSDLIRSDTQKFLTGVLGNDYIRYATPYPYDVQFGLAVFDGRYLYFGNRDDNNNNIVVYDNSQNFNTPSAWSLISFSYDLYPAGYIPAFAPKLFDGKYVYWLSGSYLTISMSILRYDTTTKQLDYIIFKRNGTLTYSDGSVSKTIIFDSYSYNYSPVYYHVSSPIMTIGSRYIYISEVFGGDGIMTLQDFVRYDPLTLFTSFKSTLLVKYESGQGPGKSLIGQTDLNEFVMKAGKSSDQFTLRFVNPVREFWVVVQSPGRVKRLTLRLNDTILVDDDQTMTNTLRSFESHSQMPTSNVCVYSFAIDPEKLQPSGTLNMSRIAFPTLELGLVSQATSDLYVRVYAKTFNVLQCQNGLGGLLFNSAL